jgi:hypothetical protein
MLQTDMKKKVMSDVMDITEWPYHRKRTINMWCDQTVSVLTVNDTAADASSDFCHWV